MSRDLERLQGSWAIHALELDGALLPAEILAGGRVVIAGERFTSTGMGATYSGTLVVDAAKRPRHLDMKFDAGPERGNTNLCIYELDGDTLKLCIATRGAVRPPRFHSPPGSGFAFETLTRSGDTTAAAPALRRSKRAVPARAGAERTTELEGEWRMVSGVLSGKPMDDDTVKWVKRVTKGQRTTVYAGAQVMMAFEFTSDASSSPRAIDYTHTAGANNGKRQAGIYDLAAGRLTILMAAPGAPRPTRLDTAPGKGATLTVWARAK
jgi:uncharacterized protein (TIGR03067 family)